MELTAAITLGVFIVGFSWRVLSKIDKSAAETRGELREEIQTNREELREELLGEIQINRKELREEIQIVGDNVKGLDNRVGHYEQRVSYEGRMELGHGANPPAGPLRTGQRAPVS